MRGALCLSGPYNSMLEIVLIKYSLYYCFVSVVDGDLGENDGIIPLYVLVPINVAKMLQREIWKYDLTLV